MIDPFGERCAMKLISKRAGPPALLVAIVATLSLLPASVRYAGASREAGSPEMSRNWNQRPTLAAWICVGETPEPGGYGEAIVSTDTAIYTARCRNASSRPEFWRYDRMLNEWETMSVEGLPDGLFRNGTALAWNALDDIYVLCGGRYSDERFEFYRYRLSTGGWTRLADTPTSQGAGDAMTWSGEDGYPYALIGSKDHGTTFARYDPDFDVWDVMTAPPGRTDDGCSLAWTGGGFLHALRGEYHESEPCRDFWQYDIATDDWVEMAEIPDDGGVGDGGSLLWVGAMMPEQTDYLYALGGGSCDEDPGSAFYRYSITDGTWTELEELPYPVGSYNGNRLGFVSGYVYCWQGGPSSYPGGGTSVCKYERLFRARAYSRR